MPDRSGDTTVRKSRFIVWIAAVSALALIAGACGGGDDDTGSEPVEGPAFPSSAPASEDTGTLKVLTFAGDDDPMYDEAFMAKYPNAKVEYEFGDSNEDFFSKVSTASVDADIVYGACVNFLPNWHDADLIAPIDTSRLTNWADLNTDVEALGQIDSEQWEAVAYYGYDSLVVSTEGGPGPTSWADLWEPDWQGQFSMIDYAENGVQMAAVVLDLPYPDLSDDQLEQIKQKLLDLAPNVRSYWSTLSDPIQQLSNGEIKIFYGWPSQYATVVQDGKVTAEYLNPSEGRLSWSCGAVVMADTEHYDLALAWIDGRLSAESGAKYVDNTFSGHANTKALEQADQETVTGLGYDDPAVFSASHPAAALTDEQRQKFNQLWSEVLAS
jgi:spermidine/putrescine transport system substrate-binding protein